MAQRPSTRRAKQQALVLCILDASLIIAGRIKSVVNMLAPLRTFQVTLGTHRGQIHVVEVQGCTLVAARAALKAYVDIKHAACLASDCRLQFAGQARGETA